MSAEQYEIVYFNGRGRAELSRLILTEAGIAFKDTRVDNWQELKNKTPTGQLPNLKIGDKLFAQSHAIERYLAKVANLYPASAEGQLDVDMLAESTIDLAEALSKVNWAEEKEKEAKKAEFLEKHWPRWAKFFDGRLSETKTGFLHGDALTLADLALFNVVDNLAWKLGAANLDAYPGIKAHHKAVSERAKLAPYIAARPVTNF